jgi:hypothetical protein
MWGQPPSAVQRAQLASGFDFVVPLLVLILGGAALQRCDKSRNVMGL